MENSQGGAFAVAQPVWLADLVVETKWENEGRKWSCKERQKHPTKETDSTERTEDGGATRARNELLKMLMFFRDNYSTMLQIYNAAIMLVPADVQDEFHAAVVGRASIATLNQMWMTGRLICRIGGAQSTQASTTKNVPRIMSRPFEMLDILSHVPCAPRQERTSTSRITAEKQSAHAKRVRSDRRRVQKKFFKDNDISVPDAEDTAPNDAGLLAPVTSARANFVEKWCKFCASLRSALQRCGALGVCPLPIGSRKLVQTCTKTVEGLEKNRTLPCRRFLPFYPLSSIITCLRVLL